MSAGSPFAGKVRIRAAALIIQDKHILLVRQQVPTRTLPIWLPPGGGILPGETSKQALKREIKEETGLIIQHAHLKYVHEFIELPYHAVELYFKVKGFSGEVKTGTDPELGKKNQQILSCRWIPLTEIDQIDLYPRFLKGELHSGTFKTAGIHHHKS